MTSIKSIIVFFGLTTLVFVGQAPAALALNLKEAESATEKFLQRVVDKDLEDLANYLSQDSLFGKHPAGAWQQSVDGIKTVFRLADIKDGDLKFEKIDQKKLGNSLISNRYIVMFPDQPLLFDFMLYKFDSEWVFFNMDFQFGTNSLPILKRWFDGAD